MIWGYPHLWKHPYIYIHRHVYIFSVDLPSSLSSMSFLTNHPYANKARTSKGEHEKTVERSKRKLSDVHLAVHMAALLQKASLCLLRCSQGAILFGHDNQVTIFFNRLKRFPHPELVPCTPKILGFATQARPKVKHIPKRFPNEFPRVSHI